MKRLFNVVIVCGLHRSATTYVGKIISKSKDVYVLHEPCNPDFGIQGIPVWYPYLREDNGQRDIEIKKIFDKIVQVSGEWNRHIAKKDLKILQLVGSRHFHRWNYLKFRRMIHKLPKIICWKDPFVTFSLDFLNKRYNGKAICMIRHPGAWLYSNIKLGWFFDINNLVSQRPLIDTFSEDIPKDLWVTAESNSVVSFALLWKLMARVIYEQNLSQNELLVVRHEDLIDEPVKISKKICKHLEVTFTRRMEKYIDQTTHGARVENPEGKVHSFTRDSRALKNVWRTKLKKKEYYLLKNIIGDDIRKFGYDW